MIDFTDNEVKRILAELHEERATTVLHKMIQFFRREEKLKTGEGIKGLTELYQECNLPKEIYEAIKVAVLNPNMPYEINSR